MMAKQKIQDEKTKKSRSEMPRERSGERLPCSECFKNEGLRLEAEKLGKKDGELCLLCKSTDGVKLGIKDLERLTRIFFVHGSKQLTEGDGDIPVYQFRCGQPNERILVHFDHTLQEDHELISASTKNILFPYGPPTYLLGGTLIGEQLESALNRTVDSESLTDEARQVLDKIIDYCGITTIAKGTKIYRARLNCQNPVSVQEYDSPPVISCKDRFNIDDALVFYGAFDVESCIHECRSTVYDEINIATFLTQETLRVVDLENSPVTDRDIKSFIDTRLFRSESYKETQALSKRAFERLYDGVKYESYFSIVRDGSRSNIALFGSPVKEGRIVLKSINRIKLDRIRYTYTFGPVFDIERNNSFIDEMDRLLTKHEIETNRETGKGAIDYDRYFETIKKVLEKYT